MEASSSQQQQQMPSPPTPPQQQQMQPPPQPAGVATNPARGANAGGRGGRGSRGGRTATGGRSIVNVNNHNNGRGGNQQRGGGRGRGGEAQKVSANSGVPFGHVPSYLPGSSSLVEELDQRIMIVLRDGRHLVGNLRTFDQYSNLVLDNASERRFHSDDDEVSESKSKITYFTDVSLGMYIVRGDSIVLLGQVGSEEEESSENNAQQNNPMIAVVSMKRLENEEFEDLVASKTNADDDEKPEGNADAPNEGVETSKLLEWDFDKDLLA